MFAENVILFVFCKWYEIWCEFWTYRVLPLLCMEKFLKNQFSQYLANILDIKYIKSLLSCKWCETDGF